MVRLSVPHRLVGRDVAVDLGTANTLVYVRGRGVLLDEPSVIAIDQRTKRPLAAGHAAKAMVGRAPREVRTIRPLKDGVITDFETTETMLRCFMQRVQRRAVLSRHRVVVCAPSGITPVERRAVVDSTYRLGARGAYVIEEPIAAAIGVGLPIHEPIGHLVVDIGAGTSEVAVVALGSVVLSHCLRVGGDELDQAIANYVKREHGLLLGERTAEEVKIALGAAIPLIDDATLPVKGRDLASGMPKTVTIRGGEVREAIEEPVSQIVDAVTGTLDVIPPELAVDVMDHGIVLTGGGALLRGLDERLRRATDMLIHLAEAPLHSVAIGSGRCLERFEEMRPVLFPNGEG